MKIDFREHESILIVNSIRPSPGLCVFLRNYSISILSMKRSNVAVADLLKLQCSWKQENVLDREKNEGPAVVVEVAVAVCEQDDRRAQHDAAPDRRD